MKWKHIAFMLLAAISPVLAHEGIELGPNKGRILEVSTDESLHAEITEKDGKIIVALLDHDMKPVKLDKQELTATGGTREAPEKLTIKTKGDTFILAAPPAGQWVIFQFKTDAAAKAITARLHFNTASCEPCKQPEWRCACKEE